MRLIMSIIFVAMFAAIALAGIMLGPAQSALLPSSAAELTGGPQPLSEEVAMVDERQAC